MGTPGGFKFSGVAPSGVDEALVFPGDVSGLLVRGHVAEGEVSFVGYGLAAVQGRNLRAGWGIVGHLPVLGHAVQSIAWMGEGCKGKVRRG